MKGLREHDECQNLDAHHDERQSADRSAIRGVKKPSAAERDAGSSWGVVAAAVGVAVGFPGRIALPRGEIFMGEVLT